MSFLEEFKKIEAESSGGFELIPEGTYSAVIDNSTVDLTKSPARLSVKYKIVDGEFKNRVLFSNYNMEGKGLGFLKKDMKTLGIDYSNVQSEQDVAKLMFGMVGAGVEVYVNQREWNGKKYNGTYLNNLSDGTADTGAGEWNI
jgi:Protein of unknown function (DUF669)